MSNALLIFITVVYFLILFLIAEFVEKKKRKGVNLTKHALIYVLTLGIYATAWTFYGSVGSAANSSFLFLSVYIAPTLMMIFAYSMLKRLVRIKNEYGITSIADYLSGRYGKSFGVGAMVALIALIGGVPYFALQIKAVVTSYTYISNGNNTTDPHLDLIILSLIVLFAIFFGFRKLNQTETHSGLVMVVAIQSVIKLVALVLTGVFVAYIAFNNLGDLFETVRQSPDLLSKINDTKPSFSLYLSYFILSMSAIMFLPRMFHVMVVENTDEKHLRTAIWALPAYLVFVTIFTFPVAMAGTLLIGDSSVADMFTLLVPLVLNNSWLALLVFIGGLSAAFSMIVISTIAITTMVANNLVIPIVEKVPQLGFMQRYFLQTRWAIVVFLLAAASVFANYIGDAYVLVQMGIISFAAVFQFAPSIIGGLYWKRASRIGALSGLIGGFAVWFYTSLLPAFVKSGWFSESILNDGPLGISFLRPENLFGITTLHPLAITVFFSLVFNAGIYILFSYLFPNSKEEQRIADNYVGILNKENLLTESDTKEEATISVSSKKDVVLKIFAPFLSSEETTRQTSVCLEEAGIIDQEKITLSQLTKLNAVVEKKLANYIGGLAANNILSRISLFTTEESQQLSTVYTRMAAKLKISPEEFVKKVNYYLDREKILVNARKELETQVAERTKELEDKNLQLERINKFMVGRELKMVELKEKIRKIEDEKT